MIQNDKCDDCDDQICDLFGHLIWSHKYGTSTFRGGVIIRNCLVVSFYVRLFGHDATWPDSCWVEFVILITRLGLNDVITLTAAYIYICVCVCVCVFSDFRGTTKR